MGATGVDSISKGDIIIQDDVWIGYGAIILSGVKIGKGAVIGAGCVVAKDVKPYEIVIGNPMRSLGNRFDDEIISKLINIDYNSFNKTFLLENLDVFYSGVDIKVCKLLDEMLNKKSKLFNE